MVVAGKQDDDDDDRHGHSKKKTNGALLLRRLVRLGLAGQDGGGSHHSLYQRPLRHLHRAGTRACCRAGKDFAMATAS